MEPPPCQGGFVEPGIRFVHRSPSPIGLFTGEAEMAPAEMRGTLTSMYNMMITTGRTLLFRGCDTREASRDRGIDGHGGQKGVFLPKREERYLTEGHPYKNGIKETVHFVKCLFCAYVWS